MVVYRVRGWFRAGISKQHFTREVMALRREEALERVLSEMGSRHGVRRNQIHIEEVVEIRGERGEASGKG